MSDLQLRQDVVDELEYEPSVDAAHIGISVDKGVVTLTGHVASYAEKQVAIIAVRRVEGRTRYRRGDRSSVSIAQEDIRRRDR